MRRELGLIVGGVALTAIGVAGGFLAAGQADDAADHGHDVGAQRRLAPETLANLGVEIGKLTPAPHVRTAAMQAIAMDLPMNSRPLVAPYGGVIRAVLRRPGDVVERDEPILTLVRDAIPRPELRYASDLLKPVSEELHDSFGALRSAALEVRLAERELERVRDWNARRGADALPLVSKQTEIDLGYAVDRTKQRLEVVRGRLEFHGLTADEIAAVEGGGHPPHNRELWQRALAHHGLWGPGVAQLHAMLPETVRDLPWTIALLGELAAAGLVDESLNAAFEREPRLCSNFHDVASLLLNGNTTAWVTDFLTSGGLAAVVELRPPSQADVADWDVVSVAVRPGERVAIGDELATVRDATSMYLAIEPLGDEVRVLQTALAAGAELSARPLVAGTGPDLEGLEIERIAAPPGSRTVAFVRCDNEAIVASGPESRARSWRIVPGQRWVVRVPTSAPSEPVLVLPVDAVIDDHGERVVFRFDGVIFKEIPVRVLYEDSEVVVLPADAVRADDDIVIRGAVSLDVALHAGEDAGGHTHPH